jgi:cob(I)alamin adenosyltransferase
LRIYTGFGDDGKTKLYGGETVDKDNLRVEVYGTLDELNSLLGLVLTYPLNKNIEDNLVKIQNDLFCISSELATPESYSRQINYKIINNTDIQRLEKLIDDLENELTPLNNFILPGGSKVSALLHLCRTVCRRAERRLVSLKKNSSIRHEIKIYLNRLSDLLFVAARYINKEEGIDDIPWLNQSK